VFLSVRLENNSESVDIVGGGMSNADHPSPSNKGVSRGLSYLVGTLHVAAGTFFFASSFNPPVATRTKLLEEEDNFSKFGAIVILKSISGFKDDEDDEEEDVLLLVTRALFLCTAHSCSW